MATKTAERRAQLGENLIQAALRRIAADGLGALRARDLANDVGCAVGGIYNVFGDMQELILQANAITFKELGHHVAEAVRGEPTKEPVAQLIAMGTAYLDYAEEHPRRWSALFEVNVPVDAPLPDWYRKEIAALFDIIAAPLRALHPDWSEPQVHVFVRTLFSAVHGIVLLGVQRRISAVPSDKLRSSLAMMVRAAATGDARVDVT